MTPFRAEDSGLLTARINALFVFGLYLLQVQPENKWEEAGMLFTRNNARPSGHFRTGGVGEVEETEVVTRAHR